jgi:hypothetical protein
MLNEKWNVHSKTRNEKGRNLNGFGIRRSSFQAWYAEFLLEINFKILLRKTRARLNFKIALISLHIDADLYSNRRLLVQCSEHDVNNGHS